MHRVSLPPKEGVNPWSLCLIFRRRRDWGFHTKSGWVDHQTFLEQRGKQHHD
jgi:hypothetical protein